MEHSSLAEPDTLPKYLLQTAARYGSKKVAMRKKELGIWREYSWQESLDQVKYLTLGLLRLGLTRGDKVAILGENDPQYYWAELAIQAAGAAAGHLYRLRAQRGALYRGSL